MGDTATLSKLDIVLRADTRNLDAGLDKSTTGLNKLKSTVDTNAGGIANRLNMTGIAGDGLKMLGSAFGVVAGAALVAVGAVSAFGAGLLVLATKQATVIADMEKMAATLGMSSKAFSGLASSSGLDAETFANSMSHLERSLSEATLSGGATAQSLNRIGLSARDLLEMRPEQQLERLATALQGVKNQADKLRISQELFGKAGGFAFTNILGTPGQMQKMLDQSRRFGLEFTQEQGEAVRRSNKAWGQFGKGITGVGNQLAIALAPAYEYFGNLLGKVAEKIVDFTKATLPYIDLFWQGIKRASDEIQTALAPIYNALESTGIGKWFAENLDDARKFGVELYDLFKMSIGFIVENFRGQWEMLKFIFNNPLTDILFGWSAFMATFQAGFEWLASAMGIAVTSWQDFKKSALTSLITVEFVFTNWQRYADVAIGIIQLRILQFAQSIRNMVIQFQDQINSMISMYNSLATALGLETIKISVELPNLRNFENEITDLTKTLALRAGRLVADEAQFIADKMNALLRQVSSSSNAVRQQGATNTPLPTKDNSAAERGSVEAFKIIAGDKADKQFNVLNDILAEYRAERTISAATLRELQSRFTVALGRL